MNYAMLTLRPRPYVTAAAPPPADVGWNISSAAFVQSFSVATEENNPWAVTFKPDGTQMYVVGSTGDDVNEYALSTPWDISTASYVQAFSVLSQDSWPHGIAFKPDGTRMYIAGLVSDTVSEYSLSTAWDVSTASYVQAFSASAQDAEVRGLAISPDGTKLFIVGNFGDDVNEYTLSTAWDVSSASFVQAFSVAAQETTPTGVFFRTNGTRMYVSGISSDSVHEYVLPTPWNVSTATYLRSLDVSPQDTDPAGLYIRSDGLKLYVVGNTGDDINEYDLS